MIHVSISQNALFHQHWLTYNHQLQEPFFHSFTTEVFPCCSQST